MSQPVKCTNIINREYSLKISVDTGNCKFRTGIYFTVYTAEYNIENVKAKRIDNLHIIQIGLFEENLILKYAAFYLIFEIES